MAPREVNWLIGVGLLGLIMFGAFFTGSVLRWDQESYEAMVHNMELTTLLGAFSGFFSDAFTTSVAMLPRLYIAHVSIVPLILIYFLIAHNFLIRYHGVSPTPAQEEADRLGAEVLPGEPTGADPKAGPGARPRRASGPDASGDREEVEWSGDSGDGVVVGRDIASGLRSDPRRLGCRGPAR